MGSEKNRREWPKSWWSCATLKGLSNSSNDVIVTVGPEDGYQEEKNWNGRGKSSISMYVKF